MYTISNLYTFFVYIDYYTHVIVSQNVAELCSLNDLWFLIFNGSR